jgi:tagatose 1,6-diphosphate aldolase
MASLPDKKMPTKEKGLQAVSNARGIIAALAIDQRSALRKLFAKAQGVEESTIPAETLERFKETVCRILTPHTSAILLDPEYGLPASRVRAKNAGLLLAYEQTGYDPAVPGRLPRLLPNYSVRRLVEAGADCVKVLLYYSPFSAPEINDCKHAWVERVGAECAAAGVPFFLELVAYHDEIKSPGIEFARIKPEIVTRSLEEFSNPYYGVDIFKVGVPVAVAFVEGIGGGPKAYSRQETLALFRRSAAAASRPFIYLSEGVTADLFRDALELAAESGVQFSGILCGRATWSDGVEICVKRGQSALENWLSSTGVENVQALNGLLENATPWSALYRPTPAKNISA